MKIVRALRIFAAVGYVAGFAFAAWLFLFSRSAAHFQQAIIPWGQADTTTKTAWVLMGVQVLLVLGVVITSFFPSSKALRLVFAIELVFGIGNLIFRAFADCNNLPIDSISNFAATRMLMGMSLWFESNIKTYGHIWGKHQPKK